MSPTRSQFRCSFPWSSASSKSNSDVLICQLETNRHLPFKVKLGRFRPPDERLGRPANVVGHAGFGRNEFRSEPGKQSNQVVRYQNLPVALGARADADGWNLERFSDPARGFGSD